MRAPRRNKGTFRRGLTLRLLSKPWQKTPQQTTEGLPEGLGVGILTTPLRVHPFGTSSAPPEMIVCLSFCCMNLFGIGLINNPLPSHPIS